jgi:hypothetical protein
MMEEIKMLAITSPEKWSRPIGGGFYENADHIGQ